MKMGQIQQIDAELQQVVRRLISEYGAQQVILFGSMAGDRMTEQSDVDLVVIKETALPFFDRLKEVADIGAWHYPFDVLVYTPSEFDDMCRNNAFVREEVVGKGKVLYEKAS